MSLCFLILLHLIVFAGPLFWRVPPESMNPAVALSGWSLTHPLGVDDLGRDELSRMLYGGRVTLAVGFASMAFSVILGVIIGTSAAFFGGVTDVLLMRLTDAMMAIPNLFFVLVALTVLGKSPLMVVLVIGFSSWMQVARVVYGETLKWKAYEFVEASVATGASPFRTLVRHILPQTYPSVIVSATLGIAWSILTESAISYLGLGIQPPTPSWGNMLQNAQQYVWTAPMLAVLPGMGVTLVVLAYNFLGDGLRDALDSRY
ncbi:MAG: ABC transporter permease [Firmicutes bacterium]|nr:ABC transporter permease [Bacillota bacterium]